MNTISPGEALDLVQSGGLYTPIYALTDSNNTMYQCESLMVTLDENGDDYINVEATLANLDSPDVLAAPLYLLTLGLEFPDLGKTCPNMASYQLTARTLTCTGREANRLTLQSLEALIRDASADKSRVYTSSSSLVVAISEIIHATLPSAQIKAAVSPTTTFLEGDDTLQWQAFRNNWAGIQEICDGAAATCYFDGHVFQLIHTDRQTPKRAYRAPLGQIKEYTLSINREKFANSVTTKYKNGITARVDHTEGAYAVSIIGRKTLIDDIPHDGSQTQAYNRAKARLRRAVIAGNELTCTLNRLPFGLMPGDTASAQTLEGTWKGTISSIEYNLLEAETLITLKQARKEQ